MGKITIKVGSGIFGANPSVMNEFEISEGITVYNMLTKLSQRYCENFLKQNVIIIVNGKILHRKYIDDFMLKDEDVVSLFRAHAGG